MKKTISIFLVILMIMASFAVSAFATDGDNLHFLVAADLHMDDIKETLDINHPESELFFHTSGSGVLYNEVTGITKSFFEKAKNLNPDFVLIPGDLTRNGSKEQHTYTANLLKEFQDESGIQVYVVPGNHDYYSDRCNQEGFKEIYKDFGYSKAITVDEKTASYVVDLNSKYRLIAVDSVKPDKDGDGLTFERYQWIKHQAIEAKHSDKKVLLMMHHPLLEHLPLGRLLMSDFVVKNTNLVAERFCNWGIEFVFTGHEHGNDIAKYTGLNGKTVYDILTTSLTTYPLEFREINLNQRILETKMHQIDKCDFSSLIDGYTSEQIELMKTDYDAYALGCFKKAIEKKILKFVSSDSIKKKLKSEGGLLAEEIDFLMGSVKEALTMPLYDGGNGELSIEALAKEKSVTIPKSEYKSLIDMVTSIVAMHYYGDENIPSDSHPECEILVKGLNTGLEYILSKNSRKSLMALLNMLPVKSVLNEAEIGHLNLWFIVLGSEYSYLIANRTLFPILDKFAVNQGLDDRNATIVFASDNLNNSAIFDSFPVKSIF